MANRRDFLMRASFRRATYVAIVTVVLGAGVAFAGPEDPDPNFGTNGEALLGGKETLASMVKALPDGRLLVAIEATFGSDGADDSRSQAGVRRLLGDGQNDPTFGGGDGFLGASEICGTDCRVVGISLAAEGTYVATSRGVYRLTDEGTVDRGFGANGVGAAPLGYPYFAPMSLIAQGSAGIVVTGDTDSRDGGGPIAIYRLGRDGSLDPSFGEQGVALPPLASDDRYVATAIDMQGRLLVANGSSIVRLLANGTTDPTFASQGPWTSDPAKYIVLDGLMHDGAGRVLAVGSERIHAAGDYPQAQAVVLAFRNNDGALDPSFGDGGIVRLVTDRPGEDSFATAIALDTSGRIVVTGTAGHYSYTNFSLVFTRVVVARLLANGVPDTDFAAGGIVAFWSGQGAEGASVDVRPGGGIVVAGLSQDRPGYSGKYVNTKPRAVVFAVNGGDAGRVRPSIEATAVEFFHADFGHYFVTADAGEAHRLDIDPAWARTGQTFAVWPYAAAGMLPVCRFWSDQRFSPRSSHFYTPDEAECAKLLQEGFWTFEGAVFSTTPAQPVEDRLACPSGTQPLYRAYNNGMSGAPNHRFTIDLATLDSMVAQGWTMEGDGLTKIFTCVPLRE